MGRASILRSTKTTGLKQPFYVNVKVTIRHVHFTSLYMKGDATTEIDIYIYIYI